MKKLTSDEVNKFISQHYFNRVNKGETDAQLTAVPANSIVVYKDSKDNSVLLKFSVTNSYNYESNVSWTREFVIPNQYKDNMVFINLNKQKSEPEKKEPTLVQGSLF
jgi:hypothetical protein